MAENYVKCDNCGKYAHVTDCHGWFSLKTWVTKPSPEQLALYQRMGEVPAGMTAAERPPVIGGDLCSVRCLTEFIDGNRLLMEASGLAQPEPETEVGFVPDRPEWLLQLEEEQRKDEETRQENDESDWPGPGGE